MKQNDIAMLILIVSISFMVALPLGNALLAGEGTRSAEVEVVQEITPEFPQPSGDIFNDKAVNLVKTIKIGETTSDNPFGD